MLRGALLGVASGLAVALAGEPHALSFVALLGPALLLLAIETPSGAPVPPRHALLVGFVSGVTTNVLSMDWILHTLGVYGNLPLAVCLLLGSLLWMAQALPVAAGAWMASGLMRARVPGWLALTLASVVAASYAPMIFPWRLAASQVCGLLLAQGAELSGPASVDLVVLLVGTLAIHALRRRSLRAGLFSGGLLLLALVLGAWRMQSVAAAREAATHLRVGVVQPNIGIFEKHDPRLIVPHMILHREMTVALEREGADLVVWPESSYPFWMRHDAQHDGMGHERILTSGVRGPLVFGVLTYLGEHRWNSAAAMTREGVITGIADKTFLMPFTERTYHEVVAQVGVAIPRGFDVGPGPQALDVEGVRIGILNCYEDLLSEQAQGTARLGTGFLLNLTNDAWFGDTSAPHLHHMLGSLRAIETRLDLVRAVNTGVSGHVLATGETAFSTGTYEQTSFIADVALAPCPPTLYVALGDWLSPLLLGALLGIALAHARRRSLYSLPD